MLDLTPAQRNVLEVYIDSKDMKEAAERLGIHVQTVKNHLYFARQNNGAKSTRELIYRLLTDE